MSQVNLTWVRSTNWLPKDLSLVLTSQIMTNYSLIRHINKADWTLFCCWWAPQNELFFCWVSHKCVEFVWGLHNNTNKEIDNLSGHSNVVQNVNINRDLARAEKKSPSSPQKDKMAAMRCDAMRCDDQEYCTYVLCNLIISEEKRGSKCMNSRRRPRKPSRIISPLMVKEVNFQLLQRIFLRTSHDGNSIIHYNNNNPCPPMLHYDESSNWGSNQGGKVPSRRSSVLGGEIGSLV